MKIEPKLTTGKPDGKCWCPSVNETDIKNNTHKLCGGIVDMKNIVIAIDKGKKMKK